MTTKEQEGEAKTPIANGIIYLECSECGLLCFAYVDDLDWFWENDNIPPGPKEKACGRCAAAGYAFRPFDPLRDIEKTKRTRGCTISPIYWNPSWR